MIAVVRCDVDEREVLLGEADVVGHGGSNHNTTVVYRCPTCGGLVELRAGRSRAEHRPRSAVPPSPSPVLADSVRHPGRPQ